MKTTEHRERNRKMCNHESHHEHCETHGACGSARSKGTTGESSEGLEELLKRTQRSFSYANTCILPLQLLPEDPDIPVAELVAGAVAEAGKRGGQRGGHRDVEGEGKYGGDSSTKLRYPWQTIWHMCVSWRSRRPSSYDQLPNDP